MTTFSSIIQILTVENEERTSKSKGTKYKHFAARSILIGDDGQAVTVGALRTRDEALQAKCKPGTFTATFALQVPDFGDSKGDITAVLVDLTPIAQASLKPAAAPRTPSSV